MFKGDYWLISNNLVNDVSKCEMSASSLTDHCVILLSLLLCKHEHILNPISKFNNSLLENTDFCKEVKQLAGEIVELEMSFLNGNGSNLKLDRSQLGQVNILLTLKGRNSETLPVI